MSRQLPKKVGDAPFIQRFNHAARSRHAFRNGQRPVPRDQKVGLFEVDVILAMASLIGDLKNVAKAIGGNGRNPCPPLFDQRIGCQCGPVNKAGDVLHLCLRPIKRAPGPQHRAVSGVIVGEAMTASLPSTMTVSVNVPPISMASLSEEMFCIQCVRQKV